MYFKELYIEPTPFQNVASKVALLQMHATCNLKKQRENQINPLLKYTDQNDRPEDRYVYSCVSRNRKSKTWWLGSAIRHKDNEIFFGSLSNMKPKESTDVPLSKRIGKV